MRIGLAVGQACAMARVTVLSSNAPTNSFFMNVSLGERACIRRGTTTRAPALPARMVLRMKRFEPLARHVGVDGGGGNIGVAQQQLYHPQICTVVEQEI